MLGQFLVGGAARFLQHNNTCPGDGGGSCGCQSGGCEDHMVTIVAIDQHHGCRGLSPDGRTYIGGFRLGVRLFFCPALHLPALASCILHW